MNQLLAVALALLISLQLAAEEPAAVIQIQRRLRMSRNEPPPAREVYINQGNRAGLKPGDTFWVYRLVTAIDEMHGDVTELLPVRLRQVQVLEVGEFSSVAREIGLREASILAKIDYPVIMVGDIVQRIADPQPQ